MSIVVTESKTTAEVLDLVFDFSNRLSDGEIIVTCASNVVVKSGEDLAPTAMLLGAPSNNNETVTQVITGGVGGVIYKFAGSARTDKGNILVIEILVAVTTVVANIPPTV